MGDEDEAMTARALGSGEVMGSAFQKKSLKDEQAEAGKNIGKKLRAARSVLNDSLEDKFKVAPTEEELKEALGGKAPKGGTLSVKRKLSDLPGEEVVPVGKKGKKKHS